MKNKRTKEYYNLKILIFLKFLEANHLKLNQLILI